ncbi:MAG: hypothetical protein KF684_07135 [Phycisphaeraceae bacterium]|nr:hypothetical protein [Phycisphaeraceae bacterium]
MCDARCSSTLLAALALSCVPIAANAASVLSIPTSLNLEDAYRQSSLPLMDLVVGPTLAEAAGYVRHESGAEPRASTTTLNLPAMRSSATFAALQQALVWDSLLSEMHRGDRDMAEYWRTGSIEQGESQFGALTMGQDLLERDTPRRVLRSPEPERVASLGGIARALMFSATGASGGGGGGGGGSSGRSGLQLPVLPPSVDGLAPVVNPDRIPPAPSPAPAPAPQPTQPQPVIIIIDLGDLAWVDPTFASTPTPSPRPDTHRPNGPFDNDDGPATGSPPAIPAPTAGLLGGIGLFSLLGARRRRSA